MTLRELLDFIDRLDSRVQEDNHKRKSYTKEQKILARNVKLTEELGELSDEVLSFIQDQRSEKLERHTKETVSEELSDVIITALLLGKSMDLDIESSLADKIDTIKRRHNLN